MSKTQYPTISLFRDQPLTAKADLLVLAVFSQTFKRDSIVVAMDRALAGALLQAVEDEDFQGKALDSVAVLGAGRIAAKRVALVGLGQEDKMDAAQLMHVGAVVTKLGARYGAIAVALCLPDFGAHAQAWTQALCRGVCLGAYRFSAYRRDKGRQPTVKTVAIVLPKVSAKNTSQRDVSVGVNNAIDQAPTIAMAVSHARDLVNTSALQLYPETFVKVAQTLAKESGFQVKVLHPEALKKLGMHLLLGVGRGSERTPRLVHARYVPKATSAGEPIVLVGKGITFDSGGLSLKPPDSMETMKTDMAGAAAVLCVLWAVAKLRLPVHVHALMALAENMPSGTAIRPGDVITSAEGKTVEVNNTDAEGRLVLADALHYAMQLKPRVVIDLATLTGACQVALGLSTAGLFSNNEDLAKTIQFSAHAVGEDIWRLPLLEGLKDQLKSDVADLKNTGERYGGAITAALFLQEFVSPRIPWAHLDIAGPATSKKETGAFAKGATGYGVATLLHLLQEMAKK